MGEVFKCVVFRMGGETYGLEISSVKEIVTIPEILTGMPDAPKTVEGMVNLRCSVIPVVNPRIAFSLRPFVKTVESRLLIVESEGKAFALLVDVVAEIIDLDEAEVERAGAVLTSLSDNMVCGIGKHEGRLIVLLDARELRRELLDE